MFAATHPEKTTALIMYGTYAKGSWAPDYPWGVKPEDLEREILEDVASWGTTEYADRLARAIAPTQADQEAFRRWWLDWMQLSLTPAAVAQLDRMGVEVDVRDVLPSIQVPTLVLHKEGDGIDEGRYVADRISGAAFIELPGAEHSAFIGTTDMIPDEIEEFLTGARSAPSSTEFSPRCCSPTSSGPLRRQRRSAIAAGESWWNTITVPSARCSLATEGLRWIRRETASSRRSTVPFVGSGAHKRSWSVCDRSGSRSELASTPERSERFDAKAGGIAVVIGSRWAPKRAPQRCSSLGRSKIWWPGRGSASMIAANTS